MKPFQITAVDTNTSTLNDADGSVASSAGVNVGTWTTDAGNNIVITKPDGTTLTHAKVQWSFNATNQLCLADATGEAIANFGTDGPLYELAQNVLLVTPGDSITFSFLLYCQWTLDANNNLGAQFGGTPGTSTITGYVQNSSTQFVFWFADSSLAMPAQQMLGFSGKWMQVAANNDPLKLAFQGTVADGSPAGLPFKFVLSNSTAAINPISNNLELSYSDANGIHKTVLQGSLAISSTIGLTFSIADQVEDGVEKSSLSIAGTFDFSGGFANLKFNVAKTVAGPATSLAIGGSFQAQIAAIGLQINFSYQSAQCPTCGTGTVANSTTLAVGGTFTWRNGKVAFSYSDTAGKGYSFQINGEIQFGKVGIDAGLQITNDPIGGRVVTGMLGLSW
jgi:hypothetical protein